MARVYCSQKLKLKQKPCYLIMTYRNGNHYVLNLSSLPNTLNNRINIQITMGDLHQFTLRQIVWGKVPNYPWWPARIVKTLAQQTRKIYRVHFFGDPTYCYLQSQQLLDFESGLAMLSQESSVDLILRKSIQLAKAAFEKTLAQFNILEQQFQYSALMQPNIIDSFQETKFQSKVAIENMEKSEFIEKNETAQFIQKTDKHDHLDGLNSQNVIQHITGQYFQTIKSSKGYNNRKQLRAMEAQLKQLLLSKYHLRNFNKSSNCEQKKHSFDCADKKNTHFRRKIQKKRNNKKKQLGAVSGKYLNKMIKSYFNYPLGLRQQYIQKITSQINQASHGNGKKYAKIFIKATRWLKQIKTSTEKQQNQCWSQINIADLIAHKIHNQDFDLGQCLNLYQDIKKQDEEKSKITQVQACSS